MENIIYTWQKRTVAWLVTVNTTHHELALWLYMIVVFGHWAEHVVQVYQVYAMGWAPGDAGGVLGLWFPALVEAEILHWTYNFFLFGGILLLRPGFSGRSRFWWNLSVGAQSWHFAEHTLLQLQWLTGFYLFGAAKQIGIGQLLVPRVELHFLYNLIVFIPMAIGMYYRLHQHVEGHRPVRHTSPTAA